MGDVDGITAVDGSGGVEVKGVEGDRYSMGVGMRAQLESDGRNHEVRQLFDGPGVLTMPLQGESAEGLLLAFGMITDDGRTLGPGEVTNAYGLAAKKMLLVLPLDSRRNVLCIRAAQLHPDTLNAIQWAPDGPVLPDETMLIASGRDGDTKPPWRWAPRHVIEAVYFNG